MKTSSPAIVASQSHTPTPWEIGHQLGDGFSIVHEVAPNCGRLVCLATAHNVGGWGDLRLNDETAKANRDFIIKACNEHANLLAALETLLTVNDGICGARNTAEALARHKAREAIAKAHA